LNSQKITAKFFTPVSINVYFSVYLTMLYQLYVYIGRIALNSCEFEGRESGHSSRTRALQQALGYMKKSQVKRPPNLKSKAQNSEYEEKLLTTEKCCWLTQVSLFYSSD
jgi:hypothetical protein